VRAKLLDKLLDTLGFLRFVLRRWSEDRCPQIAGSLTYTTLLAIAPVFAVAVALLASTPFLGDVMAKIKIFLLLNLAPEIAQTIITVYMPQLARNARRLTWVGVGTVLVVAVWLMLIMDRSLNAIWRVRQSRPYWISVPGYMAVIVLGPLLLGVSVTITTYVMMLSSEITGMSGKVHALLLRGVPVATSALAFFLLYRIIPHRSVPWRHAALGGIVAGVLFETAKQMFAFYVQASPTYNMVYGAFAAIPLFLVWIYLSWLVVLLGAELTAAAAYWANARWREAPAPATRFREALTVIQGLLEAGPGGASFERLRARTLIAPHELEEALTQMTESDVVERSGESYRLTRASREALALPAAPASLSTPRRGRGQSGGSSRRGP
jgi:membrane protein